MTFERLGSREPYGRGGSERCGWDRFRYPDGEEAQREVIAHPGAVAIVAHDGGSAFCEQQALQPSCATIATAPGCAITSR